MRCLYLLAKFPVKLFRTPAPDSACKLPKIFSIQLLQTFMKHLPSSSYEQFCDKRIQLTGNYGKKY